MSVEHYFTIPVPLQRAGQKERSSPHRRWRFRKSPRDLALTFSLLPTLHPIRPSSSPSSSPFIKYLLHARCCYIIPSSLQLCELDIIVPISQMEKLRTREVTDIQNHTAPLRWERRCEAQAVTLCNTAEPSGEKSNQGRAREPVGWSFLHNCHRAQNKESATGRGGRAAWSKGRVGSQQEKQCAEPAVEACLIAFPSTLSAVFSSGPACSTGKTIDPAWGLGAGWATFWSVFIQIPFLSYQGGGGGSHTEGGEGKAEVFISPLSSQAKKNSSLPRSFISVIYSRRCFLQYKQEAKNVGEEEKAGSRQEEKEK